METSKQIVCFDQVELFGNAKIDFAANLALVLEICIAVTSVQTTYIQESITKFICNSHIDYYGSSFYEMYAFECLQKYCCNKRFALSTDLGSLIGIFNCGYSTV